MADIREERLVGFALRREDEDVVPAGPGDDLTQTGQHGRLARQFQAEGSGGPLLPGREVGHVLQVFGGEFPALLRREVLEAVPPRCCQKEPQQLGQADGDERRAPFGVRVQDGTFLAAFPAEEERPPCPVTREPLASVRRGVGEGIFPAA